MQPHTGKRAHTHILRLEFIQRFEIFILKCKTREWVCASVSQTITEDWEKREGDTGRGREGDIGRKGEVEARKQC